MTGVLLSRRPTGWETPGLQQTLPLDLCTPSLIRITDRWGAAAPRGHRSAASARLSWGVRRQAWAGGAGCGCVSLCFGARGASSQTVTSEHAVEGFLELPAETRVDYGINAAVEVTQPEGYLKDGLRWFTGWEDGSWRTHTQTDKKHINNLP